MISKRLALPRGLLRQKRPKPLTNMESDRRMERLMCTLVSTSAHQTPVKAAQTGGLVPTPPTSQPSRCVHIGEGLERRRP